MNIRSITGFLTFHDADVRALRDLVAAARAALPIQTARLALAAPTHLAPNDLPRYARELQAACRAYALDYASLGALPGEHPLVAALPTALAATENIFAAAHIASSAEGIHSTALTNAARVIRQLADATPDGFGNLRFAALANVPPHAPFFPAAYHDGGARAFAFATEAASLAVDAFRRAQNLADARAHLVRAIEDQAERIASVGADLAARFDFRFAGIDFSFAPYPDESRSIGAALEKLSGAPFGEHGTLFATAFLTDCLRRARLPRVGFCGVMLPVLEDSTLAARAAHYTLDSLLLYSAVCGTGLDTIPLPGETSADALAAILLDVATLAVKLNKPLTARLMPIPGLRAGDRTHFDFEYFANARVLDVNARALKIFETTQPIRFVTKDE
jgi:uncharacterized protein (UPF0210 family)